MKYIQLENEIIRMMHLDNTEYSSVKYKEYLSPDLILDNKNIGICERNRISGWEQFEYGKIEWSSADFKDILMIVAKELLHDDTMLMPLTDETLAEGKMVELQLGELEVFEENYPERYGIAFMEPQDYIIFLEQGKYIIIVHHEGYVFLCVNKRLGFNNEADVLLQKQNK